MYYKKGYKFYNRVLKKRRIFIHQDADAFIKECRCCCRFDREMGVAVVPTSWSVCTPDIFAT